MNKIMKMYKYLVDKKSWLPVIIFMLIVSVIKLKFHFSGNYILAGVDGPYYPLQIRGIMEDFRLSIPDMPLLFVLEALLARCFQFLDIASTENCIIIAITFVDVVLTPLAAIPIFLLAKELNKEKTNFLTYLMVCYAIINITTILQFSNNFQKNSVAVVFIFFYIYFIFRIIKYGERRDFYYALIILLLCSLTHFGSASIALLITGTIFISWSLVNKKVLSIHFRKIFILLLSFVFFLSVLFFFDYSRFERLIYIPVKVFESPVILILLDGQNIGEYLNPLNFILPNLLLIIAFVLFLVIRKKISNEGRIIGGGLLISAFILSSPLIGIDWANRLYMMSYVPITIIYLILFNSELKKWTLIFPAFLFISSISFSILVGSKNSMLQSITDEAYNEFKDIRGKVKLNKKIAIVSRQDLKILASWEFRTMGIANYLLTENDFKKYDAVYFLTQKDGVNFSQEEKWRNSDAPSNSINVFQGIYFDLYKIKTIDSSLYGMNSRSRFKGKVVSLDNGKFVLQNNSSKKMKTLITSDKTQFHFVRPHKDLKNGMLVEVWGEGVPFSLELKANVVIER